MVAATTLDLGEPSRGFEVCGGAFREGERSTDPSSLGPLDFVRSMTSFARYEGIERQVRFSSRNGFILDMTVVATEDGVMRSPGISKEAKHEAGSFGGVVSEDAFDWRHRASR